MRRISCLLLILSIPGWGVAAQNPSDESLDFVSQFLPSCEGSPQIETQPFTTGLSRGMTARVVNLQGSDRSCSGLWLEVIRGDLGYVGQPWVLTGLDGSVEEKIRRFAWRRMNETVNASVAGKSDSQGFIPVTVSLTTEYGRIPLQGVVDSEGQIFYPGGFIPIGSDVRKHRMALLAPLLENAPRLAAGSSGVELVEFSDFQCPACQHAAEWLDPLLEQYGDRITYRRVDFPLMKAHPWAFPAALYGRAIHRQDPSRFWLFKEQVFGNQDKLSVFTLEDFALSFIEEQGLDAERFRRDVASQELRDELLRAIAVGMVAEVNGTPTYWVNGKPVAVGDHGSHLKKVLDLELEAAARP